MENQQLRSLESRLMLLARNAKFGDGHIWKHPECKNCKLVYTSTTPLLLEAKMAIAPEVFKTGPKFQDLSTAKGRFANAKPMYRLASIVHPIFTSLKYTEKSALVGTLTVEDFGLWYLDDGSTIARNDSEYGYVRSFLFIGDSCETETMTNIFRDNLRRVFNTENIGTVKRHTPFTSDKNKVWCIPVDIAKIILVEAAKYSVLKHKFPSWIKFRDHSRGEVEAQGEELRSAVIHEQWI